jgi:hypothetical protein
MSAFAVGHLSDRPLHDRVGLVPLIDCHLAPGTEQRKRSYGRSSAPFADPECRSDLVLAHRQRDSLVSEPIACTSPAASNRLGDERPCSAVPRDTPA